MTTGKAWRGKRPAGFSGDLEGAGLADEAMERGLASLAEEAGEYAGVWGPIPEDMPSPDAPIEERRRWLLEHRGAGVFAPEVLEEMGVRGCAMPNCSAAAVSRSLFCRPHQDSAVGDAGARELRQLTREMERLGRIREKEARRQAAKKFRSRVENGDFAILFSGRMQETVAQAAADAELGLELGSLRVAMARALEEIEDPREMAMAVSRLANASARTVRADSARRTERKRS